MTQPKKTRVDAWVWAVRLMKTRTDATAACRAGHIKINGERVKPAQAVGIGDRVRVWVNHREYEVEVTQLITKRVGPAIARTCYIDHSPQRPELEQFYVMPKRDRGAGKPTKRELREINRLRGRIS
ncbi:MAG: RNA-binding S4 domain-containing protein [Corynebacterium sp.]|nr:RNA-binding S4 domain-containing protein [Corynebacterium sp.]